MLQINDGKLTTVDLPLKPGCFALCKSGVRLLFALESTFAYFYLEDFTLELLSSSYKQDKNEGTGLNDGRVDRAGRFVVGGINLIFGRQKLYSVSYSKEGALNVKTLDVPNMKAANSICFSKDGSLMYHADTPTHEINVFPYKPDGSVGKANFVTNYLDQTLRASYATNVRRWQTALVNFYPQYKRFVRKVLCSIFLCVFLIFYFGKISALKFGLALSLIVALVPALPLKLIKEAPDGSIINSKD